MFNYSCCKTENKRKPSAEDVSSSRHQIITIEQSEKEAHAHNSTAEPDIEEQPYFKKVVYQSKYSIHDKRRRQKKSLLKSIRRPWGFDDDSDEDDYENVPKDDYINVGAKQEPPTKFVSAKRDNKAYKDDDDDEADYENL